MGSIGKLNIWWLAGILAALLLVGGCSGILLESKQEDGRSQRLKIDGGESWDSYDDRPRYPYSKKRSTDEMSIMLKQEATF